MVVKIKKQNTQKKCVIKRKFKFDNYTNCSKAAQLENKNYLEKSKFTQIVSFVTKENIKTVCSYHVTYAFQSEATLSSCLNVKELLARSRREI